jgi:lipoate-protein ligase B
MTHRPRGAIFAERLPWEWWGRIGYHDAVARLESQRERLLEATDGPRLFLCEHDPVITVGRGVTESDAQLLQALSPDTSVCRSSRGGRVTYHGPGQLMVYPVVKLCRGIVVYLETLARALAEVAEGLGVADAGWRRQPAGLWRGQKKLAACGIHVSRGVAIHGFAFNLTTPPERWHSFSPCGLGKDSMTSVAEELGRDPGVALATVAEHAAPVIERHLVGGML